MVAATDFSCRGVNEFSGCTDGFLIAHICGQLAFVNKFVHYVFFFKIQNIISIIKKITFWLNKLIYSIMYSIGLSLTISKVLMIQWQVYKKSVLDFFGWHVPWIWYSTTALLYSIREIPKVLIMIWERAVAAETLESCWLERGNPLTDFLISLRSLFYENYYSSESPGQPLDEMESVFMKCSYLTQWKRDTTATLVKLMMIMALAFKKTVALTHHWMTTGFP